MPRRKLIRTSEHPYHIVSRSNLKQWFVINLYNVWKIALKSFQVAYKKYPVNIHAFVLMNNHYHLIIDTPNADIDLFMYEFNKSFSLQIRLETGKINRMFGGRYKWSVIKNRNHYLHVMKYVFRNPVKANISNRVEDYFYSSIDSKRNSLEQFVKIKPYIEVIDFLEWFNISHSDKENESINKGLNKSEFNYSGSRKTRNSPKFENPIMDKSTGTF